MRIGSRDSQEKPQKLKPPPNYSSRPVQVRLLLMSGLLLLVLTAAFEARDPKRWHWIWQLTNSEEQLEEQLDPRIPAQTTSDREPGEILVGERPSTSAGTKSLTPTDSGSDSSPSANDVAWASGWQEVFEKLSYSDRTVLYELLKAARENTAVDAKTATQTFGLLDQLDAHWLAYRNAAAASVSDLSEEEQVAWQPVIESLAGRWEGKLRPLLVSLGSGESLLDEQRARLHGLQDLLDRLQLKVIQDNTVWRASEREIWFRLLGKLEKRPSEELQRASEGSTGYAQLFKQPDFYRGKLVTVRGTAEAVYPIQAPENSYGIKQYWVYWLRPEGGPNNPILVYALDKPADFPSIEYADLGVKKMPRLEDVEFTGYFFKRYAYQGQGGIYTAPMLLAKEPKWLPPSLGLQSELPSASLFFSVVAGMALLAAGLATWVYYQYRPGRSRELAERIEIPTFGK